MTVAEAQEKWTVFWSWINTIPMVQVKAFSVMMMDWVTMFATFFAWMYNKELNTTYDAWLVFLAGLNGFALGAYGVKRSTDIDYAQAKNPPSPIVNVQPPSTVNVEAPVTPPPLVVPVPPGTDPGDVTTIPPVKDD